MLHPDRASQASPAVAAAWTCPASILARAVDGQNKYTGLNAPISGTPVVFPGATGVVSDRALKLPAGTFVVQVGKRRFARVTLR